MVCVDKPLMLSIAVEQLAMPTARMNQTMLKALLIVDEKENAWRLDGRFNQSIDCIQIDLETLGIDTEDLQHELHMVAKQGDVLQMDSALAWNFVFMVALRARGKMPNSPILLLPSYHAPEGALLTFNGGVIRNGRRCGRWTPMVRKLGGYAAAVALKIKDLAPCAVMVLVVPGDSITAPLLWFYRRQIEDRVLRLPVSQPDESSLKSRHFHRPQASQTDFSTPRT